jgi:hypothetical protein
MNTPRLFPFAGTLHRLADDVSGESVIGREAEIRVALARYEPACRRALRSGGELGMSFCLSFHLALLGTSGAYWLDDRPDLRCQDRPRQHPLDGWRLSCMAALPGPARPMNDLHACQ